MSRDQHPAVSLQPAWSSKPLNQAQRTWIDHSSRPCHHFQNSKAYSAPVDTISVTLHPVDGKYPSVSDSYSRQNFVLTMLLCSFKGIQQH